MTSSVRRFALTALLLALAGGGMGACVGDSSEPVTSVVEPDSVRVRPLSMSSVQLEWIGTQSVTGASLQYVVERRDSLGGSWSTIPDAQLPTARIGLNIFVDNGLEPDTYYGYRVRAEDQIGEQSEFSPIVGVRTPPRPGIQVFANSSGNVLDPNGFVVSVRGPEPSDSARNRTIAPKDRALFQPLAPGTYAVALTDVYEFCAVQGDSVQESIVTDAGVRTVDSVSFAVTCRDPSRVSIEGIVTVTGTGTDEDGFELELDGIVGDSAISLRRGIGPTGGADVFTDLLAGSYQLALRGIAPNCTLTGSATRELQAAAGDELQETFLVNCGRPGSDTTRAGYRLRGAWSPVTAGTTTYTLTLDLSTFDDPAIPGADDVFVISALVAYDPVRLTFVSSANVPGSLLQNQNSNVTSPGTVAWLNFDTDAGRATGSVGVIALNFAVSAGATGIVEPVTSFQSVDDVQSENGTDLKPRIVIVDADLTLSGGGGGGGSAPSAEANGPYSGTAGTTIAFSSAGSAASAGRTITGYSWAFSDGQTLSGAAPSRSFATAGSYTVTLTVTDNTGATGTDQATITVTGGGGGGTGQYVLRGAWSGSGSARTYTLTYDLTGFDDPAIPGADDVFVISGTTTFAGLATAGLTFSGSSNVAGSLLANQGSNLVAPGQVAWLNFDTDVARATGSVGVINLNFTGTPTGSVTPTTAFGPTDDVQSENGVNLLPKTRLEEAVLGGGGGGGGAPPTAEANGPYTGTAGTTIALSSAGSAASAGRTITGYSWAFSDGQTLTGASPSRSFATAGSYTVTLTVTDNTGATGTDQATITVTASTSSIVWRSTFGTRDANGIVTMAVTLDLRSDLPETPGAEALGRLIADSIAWDPTVLSYRGFTVPVGNAYTVIANSSAGRLSITRGEVAPGNSAGLVQIIEIRFAVLGASGRSTQTTTGLSQLQGTVGTGTFNYLPRATIVEGSYTVP